MIESKRRADPSFADIVEDDCSSDYMLHEGLLVIPIMGPQNSDPDDIDGNPVIVRVHAAYTERTARFKYIRTKRPPVIPLPEDTKLGDKYLKGNIKVYAPKHSPAQDTTYTVIGSYNFVCAEDKRETGTFRFDANSYLSNTDFLGQLNPNPDAKNPNDMGDYWFSPFFDLNFLGSSRILG